MIAIGGVEGIVLRPGPARVQRVIGRILTGQAEEIASAVRLQRGRKDRAQGLEVLHALHACLPLHEAEVLFTSTASVDNSVDERLVA